MFVILLQFLVVLLIMRWLLKKKCGEKFSGRSVLLFLGMGAVSTILCFVIQELLHVQKDLFFGMNPILSGFLTALLTAALAEEVCKYVVFRIVAAFDKEVQSWLDAIIACVIIGIGFTMLEDVTYVLGGDASVARAFLPMHLLFQFFMGYFYGKARVEKSILYDILSLIVPILVHTVYDMFIIGMISIVGSNIDPKNITEEQLMKLPYYSYVIPLAICIVVVSIAGIITLIISLRRLKSWSENGQKQEAVR